MAILELCAMPGIRDKKGKFVKGHPSIGGFQKNHPTYKGCEVGWFKKGVVPKTAFKKGHTKGHRFPVGHIPWNKGTKGIVRAWNKGLKGFLSGDKNSRWKGGTYGTERHREMGKLEYKEWRKKVFEKNNYICQICFSRGGKLEAHHIKSWKDYPGLRYEISNGITLHKDCHLIETSLIYYQEMRSKALDLLTDTDRHIKHWQDRMLALTQQGEMF